MTDRNPGPELDAQVATLMGWTRLPGDSDHHDGYWQSPDGEATPVDQLTLPPWSTNNGAAWAVVDSVRKWAGIVIAVYEDGTARVEISRERLSFQNTNIIGLGDTAPHAICLAALAAVEGAPEG